MLRGHICYAVVYPRGRVAGGLDLDGQSATLSSHTGHCFGHSLHGEALKNCDKEA